MKRGLVEVGTG